MHLNKQIAGMILFLFFISCNNYTKKDISGLYVSRNNVNTIDTVNIKNDGNYINIVYRKLDNSLVYKNVGKWHSDGKYITFEKFFKDEDDVHNKEFTKFDDILITTMLPIEKLNGKIIIHHKSMYENIYLEKIK